VADLTGEIGPMRTTVSVQAVADPSNRLADSWLVAGISMSSAQTVNWIAAARSRRAPHPGWLPLERLQHIPSLREHALGRASLRDPAPMDVPDERVLTPAGLPEETAHDPIPDH